MPLFVRIFLLFTIANIALLNISSFIGEFLILTGIYKTNTTITVVIAVTRIISGRGYSLWLFNRLAYENVKSKDFDNFYDLDEREFFLFLPLIGVLL
jgi:NADH-quinone oxidoreductase subunit M